jgi:hypothetical protein
MKNKQTAVEWLYDLSKKRELDKFDLEQAKEMERKSKSIPYQLCPKCNGDGNLLRYNTPAMISTYSNVMCDVCNGDKIIKMYHETI